MAGVFTVVREQQRNKKVLKFVKRGKKRVKKHDTHGRVLQKCPKNAKKWRISKKSFKKLLTCLKHSIIMTLYHSQREMPQLYSCE